MGESGPTQGYGVDADGLPIPFTPEEREEFEGWEQLGHEAWAMIDEREREEPLPQPGERDGT